MIRVAICDDDEREAQQVYSIMENYFLKEKICYQCNKFSDSKAFLYEVDAGICFDIFLLDIEMPKMNGMELTSCIKKLLPEALVILITFHEKYVYDSFKVQPYRFIPKDRIKEMLPDSLSDAVKEIKQQEGEYLVVNNQKGVEKILQKNITYIWHSGKYCYIEKQDGKKAKVRATLKDVYKELNQDIFEWIDRGSICNLEQIVKIEGEDIVLKNGDRLYVNGDRVVKVKNRLREYWIQKEGM